MPDAVRDAEAAVAALADSFLEWITEDIDNAKKALADAQDKPGDNQPLIRAIFEVVHNVKGQGGSFGYDLLTKIGGWLWEKFNECITLIQTIYRISIESQNLLTEH